MRKSLETVKVCITKEIEKIEKKIKNNKYILINE